MDLKHFIRSLLTPEGDTRNRDFRQVNLGHEPTRQRRSGSRHRGYTKAPHRDNKVQRKMAERSRRINRR